MFDRFQPLTNAYEVLKSKGLDQVKNKQLRFLLGSYYDDEANRAIKSIEDVEETFKTDWIPIIREEVLDIKFKSYVILRDIKLFSEESMARNILRINRDNFNGGKNTIDGTIKTIDKIQDIITKSLN